MLLQWIIPKRISLDRKWHWRVTCLLLIKDKAKDRYYRNIKVILVIRIKEVITAVTVEVTAAVMTAKKKIECVGRVVSISHSQQIIQFIS